MGRLTVPRPSGYVVVTSPDGGLEEADTLQCVHCGCHWKMEPGSGKIRGYCHSCAGPICGPKCKVCVPAEQRLENIEQGRPLDFRPIVVGARNFDGLILPR